MSVQGRSSDATRPPAGWAPHPRPARKPARPRARSPWLQRKEVSASEVDLGVDLAHSPLETRIIQVCVEHGVHCHRVGIGLYARPPTGAPTQVERQTGQQSPVVHARQLCHVVFGGNGAWLGRRHRRTNVRASAGQPCRVQCCRRARPHTRRWNNGTRHSHQMGFSWSVGEQCREVGTSCTHHGARGVGDSAIAIARTRHLEGLRLHVESDSTNHRRRCTVMVPAGSSAHGIPRLVVRRRDSRCRAQPVPPPLIPPSEPWYPR